jgi:hypothetical protein
MNVFDSSRRHARLGFGRLALLLAVLLVWGPAWGPVFGAEPVAIRIESFTVAPSSQPLAYVVVKNLQEVPYEGSIVLAGPQGWRIAPASRRITLARGESERVPFDVQKGVTVEANRYAMEVRADGGGTTVVHRQQVACTSAPYFKPTIDGDPADWADAIPVTFETAGRKTVVSTFWSSRRLSLLVAVEEERLVGLSAEGTPSDAVQLAVSPKGAVTAASPAGQASRFEFLVVAAGDSGAGKCFQLAAPGTPLAETQEPRALGPLACDDAEVAVSRAGSMTFYEIALPFRPMRDHIRPSEGREFCLSVLVHDPDGTGVRDWGRAAGLWPWQRTPLAWSRWPGAQWGDRTAFDNKTPWGMCSSKY